MCLFLAARGRLGEPLVFDDPDKHKVRYMPG